MNKEKEIEEIIDLIIEVNPNVVLEKWVRVAAHNIIDAGYRKADEVRKEIVKEIAKWLQSQDYDFAAEIILKRYGVEVDE